VFVHFFFNNEKGFPVWELSSHGTIPKREEIRAEIKASMLVNLSVCVSL